MERMAEPGAGPAGRWTFLTNHARVLLKIAGDPEARLRDIAAMAHITERAAQGIVADLEAAGYLTRTRVGRRNHYTIHPTGTFRHPAESDYGIGGLLAVFTHRDEVGGAEGAGETKGADGTDGTRPANGTEAAQEARRVQEPGAAEGATGGRGG